MNSTTQTQALDQRVVALVVLGLEIIEQPAALALTEAQAVRLRQGQPMPLTRDAPLTGALVRAELEGKLVALVRLEVSPEGGSALQPVRVFNL